MTGDAGNSLCRFEIEIHNVWSRKFLGMLSTILELLRVPKEESPDFLNVLTEHILYHIHISQILKNYQF